MSNHTEENIRYLKEGRMFTNNGTELFWFMGKQWVSICKRKKPFKMDSPSWVPRERLSFVLRFLMTISGRYKSL